MKRTTQQILDDHAKKMTKWLNSDDEQAVKTRKGLDKAQKKTKEVSKVYALVESIWIKLGYTNAWRRGGYGKGKGESHSFLGTFRRYWEEAKEETGIQPAENEEARVYEAAEEYVKNAVGEHRNHFGLVASLVSEDERKTLLYGVCEV